MEPHLKSLRREVRSNQEALISMKAKARKFQVFWTSIFWSILIIVPATLFDEKFLYGLIIAAILGNMMFGMLAVGVHVGIQGIAHGLTPARYRSPSIEEQEALLLETFVDYLTLLIPNHADYGLDLSKIRLNDETLVATFGNLTFGFESSELTKTTPVVIEVINI